MDKNIYDLLNEVEIDLAEYEEEEMSYFEQQKTYKKFRNTLGSKFNTALSKQKYMRVASVVGILIFGTVGVMPAMATSNSAIHKIVHTLGIDKDLTPYESIIGQSETKQGLTMTINEVIVDNDQIIVSVIATSSERLVDRYAGPSGSIRINGKAINNGMYSSYQLVDEYEAQSILIFPIKEQLEGELDIQIKLSTPFYEMKHSPHWNYEFTAKGEELTAKTITHPINQVITLDNGTVIKLEKYTTNPLHDRIYFQIENDTDTNTFKIEGKDQDGNKVKFDWHMISDGKGDMSAAEGYTNIVQNASELTLSVYVDDKAVGEEFVIKK